MRHSIARNRREAKNKKRAKQNNVMLFLALILITGGLGTLVWMGMKTAENNRTPSSSPALTQKGSPAVDFSLAALNSEDIALSDYAGQVIVMNFWATWCPPCRAEMPGLNRFYEAHRDEGLVVLAINGQEDEATVRPFIEANQFSFPVLLDLNGAVARQYTTRSFPTTFIIGRDGTIQHVQVGIINEQQLDEIVLPLLQIQ
jgi:peroxiredoxin